MSPKPLHDFVALPRGLNVADVLPAFAAVEHEVHIGVPNRICGSCRKPFTAARRPRKTLLVYPVHLPVPVRFDVLICGSCLALHRRGGAARDGVLAALQAFIEGEEAGQ